MQTCLLLFMHLLKEVFADVYAQNQLYEENNFYFRKDMHIKIDIISYEINAKELKHKMVISAFINYSYLL